MRPLALVYALAPFCFGCDQSGSATARADGPGLAPASLALPFPPCRADDIDCLRRGFRTFFFMMDSGYLNMKPVDPIILNSITVALPQQQLTVAVRNVNVTGARWTKLSNRKFNDPSGQNSVLLLSDFHIVSDISFSFAEILYPLISVITMDIQNVETNITYPYRRVSGIDREEYLLMGPERIAVRNSRTPTYFLQPRWDYLDLNESRAMDQALQTMPSILEYLSNEIVNSVMHYVVDNFRLCASKISIKNYYKYA